MINFFRRLLCIHKYEYNDSNDLFIVIECRKCGKVK